MHSLGLGARRPADVALPVSLVACSRWRIVPIGTVCLRFAPLSRGELGDELVLEDGVEGFVGDVAGLPFDVLVGEGVLCRIWEGGADLWRFSWRQA